MSLPLTKGEVEGVSGLAGFTGIAGLAELASFSLWQSCCSFADSNPFLRKELTMSDEHARLALRDARGPLTDLMEKLDGDDGQTLWLPALKKLLRKENPWPVKNPKFDRVLYLEEVFVLQASNEFFDPSLFFDKRYGLRGEVFPAQILYNAKPTNSVPELKIVSYRMIQDTDIIGIQKELPEGHRFTDVDIFSAHLARMIRHQTGGIHGKLLTNGRANVFFLQTLGAIFSTRVLLFGTEWCVFVVSSRDMILEAGERVVCMDVT